MTNRHINLGSITCLVVSVYCMYRLLLTDNFLPCSISSVENLLTHWVRHWHVVVVGLMPVYVAFVLFGAAIFGIFVGSKMHHWLRSFIHQK